MRSGPATPTALCVDPLSCHPAARSCGSTVPVRQRSRRSATFTSTVCNRAVRRIARLQFLRRPAAQPAQGAGLGGGRNARATGMRSRAFPISPGNSPSRIASCHRRHRKHRSARFEIATYSLNPLWGKLLRGATKKEFTLVRKLWTGRVRCGRLRKREGKSELPTNRVTGKGLEFQ